MRTGQLNKLANTLQKYKEEYTVKRRVMWKRAMTTSKLIGPYYAVAVPYTVLDVCDGNTLISDPIGVGCAVGTIFKREKSDSAYMAHFPTIDSVKEHIEQYLYDLTGDSHFAAWYYNMVLDDMVELNERYLCGELNNEEFGNAIMVARTATNILCETFRSPVRRSNILSL